MKSKWNLETSFWMNLAGFRKLNITFILYGKSKEYISKGERIENQEIGFWGQGRGYMGGRRKEEDNGIEVKMC